MNHFRPVPLGAAVAMLAFNAAVGAAEAAGAAATGSATPEATLPKVRVEAAGEDAEGYQATVTDVGRVPQLLRDIPQSVTVVQSQLIEDRAADTFKEAVRNVAGLTFNAGEGGRIGDNITIRGYSVVGDLYLDGVRDVAQYNREVFNLDRIEVLRGSASMLFGRGSTGGVINQVSKMPKRGAENRVAFTGGTHGYRRAVADLNGSLGAIAAVRFNAMYTDDDSFRDGPHYERWGVAPAVSFGLGTADEVTLAYFRLEDDNVPDMGVPYFDGRPVDVPVDTFYGLEDADRERNETGIATATWRHTFTGDTSLRVALRRADYHRDLWATAPRLAAGTTQPSAATVVNRQRQARGGAEHTWTGQADFVTTLDTGPVSHQLLVGTEVAREDARRWNNVSGVANPATTLGNPNARPTLSDSYFATRTRANFVSYDASTFGAYFQDVVALTQSWKVVLGARYDDFEADYDRPAPQGDLSRTDRVWSWRGGVLYQPTDVASYYASYGTSFNPSGELYALDDRSANTAPEKSRNLEVGVKWDLLDGALSLRTALARSEKTNERNTDLSNPDVYLLSGKRHTDAFEIEATGRITAQWEVFGALALMDAKIDVASGQQAGTQGNVPVNAPDYTFNAWSAYRVDPSWRIGGGIEGVGFRWANAGNTAGVPGYVRVDAFVEYETGPVTVQLNAFNLLNRRYYEGVYAGHSIPGTSRAAQLRLEYEF
jgi:catecholate siderophore receptor